MKEFNIDFDPTKALVHKILSAPHAYDWTLQGFGMLRTYLTDDIRLHVWDDRYKVKGVSEIHDHPWHFKSLIVAGSLINWKYKEVSNTTEGLYPVLMTKRTIKPGEGLKSLHDEQAWITCKTGLDAPDGCTEYTEGETYEQAADEIHWTDCRRGTVTLVKRKRVGEDLAHVYFKPKAGFVSAEPRAATKSEIANICSNALRTWFSAPVTP